jgi:hypothetical protein
MDLGDLEWIMNRKDLQTVYFGVSNDREFIFKMRESINFYQFVCNL